MQSTSIIDHELEELVNPDSEKLEKEKELDLSHETQRLLVKSILTDDSVRLEASKFIKPNMFTAKPHQALVQIALELQEQYGGLPNDSVIKDLFKARFEGDKAQLAFMGELGAMDYVETSFQTRDWLMDQIRNLAAQTAIGKATLKAVAEAKKGNGKEAFIKLQGDITEAVKVFQTESTRFLFDSIDDIRQIALEQPISWFIDDWIMQKGLHMIAGHSFSGKSQLLADLATALATGMPFGTLNTRKTPVLIVDLENHESIIDARLSQGKLPEGSQGIHWLSKSVLKDVLPLDADSVRELVEAYYKHAKVAECVLFIDTQRSAFQIDEMNPEEINGLFYPLQLVAQDLNCAIVLLNHRPKTNADYAGHNSMMAALDMFMVYEREGLNSTLRMAGTRLRQPTDAYFRFNPETATLLPRLAQDVEETLTEAIVKMVNKYDGLTQDQLITKVQNEWSGKAPGIHKIRKAIEQLTDNGSIECKNNGKGGYKYQQAS